MKRHGIPRYSRKRWLRQILNPDEVWERRGDQAIRLTEELPYEFNEAPVIIEYIGIIVAL